MIITIGRGNSRQTVTLAGMYKQERDARRIAAGVIKQRLFGDADA